MKRMTKKLVITGAMVLSFVCIIVGTSAMAEDKPEVDFTTGIYSKYVWRGFELSKDSLVVQPSLTLSYKGFGVNFWGNLDTDLDERLSPVYGDLETNTAVINDDSFNWNETDFTLSYDGSFDKVGYSVGYIYYDLDGFDDSQEIYLGLSYDTLLSPSLMVYKEITGIQGWYATFGISHSVPISEKHALDLGAQIGYYDDEDTYNEFHDGMLSASMSFPMNEYITITPELNWSFALSGDASDLLEAANVSGDDNFVYGGVAVSFAF